VSTGKLLGIGAFALASGLSVNALRYYDELGLLPPAVVDPVTGYRRYRPEQVRQARLICALRRVDVPVDAVRAVLNDPGDPHDPDDSAGPALRATLEQHRRRLLDRADALSQMVRTVDHYIEHGVAMTDLKSPRVVQITIAVRDLDQAVSFYRDAFDAVFTEEISSFQFGTWPGDDFFLLTVAHEPNAHGRHEGPAGASRFGLLVADVDVAPRRALDAGAEEVLEPYDAPWKPRSSSVMDPSGNRIDLVQG